MILVPQVGPFYFVPGRVELVKVFPHRSLQPSCAQIEGDSLDEEELTVARDPPALVTNPIQHQVVDWLGS